MMEDAGDRGTYRGEERGTEDGPARGRRTTASGRRRERCSSASSSASSASTAASRTGAGEDHLDIPGADANARKCPGHRPHALPREADVDEEEKDALTGPFDLDEFILAPGHDLAAAQDAFAQAFVIITEALAGRFHPDVPVREAASPVPRNATCFLVAPPPGSNVSRGASSEEVEKADLVGVKYQSFASGKVWWSPLARGCVGVVARAMNRSVRKSGVLGAKHGLCGRWFSLITRPHASVEVKGARCRAAVVLRAPSLVFLWETTASAKHVPPLPVSLRAPQPSDEAAEEKTVQRAAMPLSLPEEDLQDAPMSAGSGNKTLPSLSSAAAELAIRSDIEPVLSCGSGRVCIRGSLLVRGRGMLAGNSECKSASSSAVSASCGIHGSLTTSTQMADYAEWFRLLNPDEPVSIGDVVQLRSPEQSVSRNTAGTGPILVVSSAPSIAAGVPAEATERARGVLCGFLGQVPVNCMGPVQCGDLMVPSGLHDGSAIPGRLSHADRLEPLGYAMETYDAAGPCKINCLVRWHGDPRWQALRDERLCKVRRRWYKEVLPRHTASILVRGLLFAFVDFHPSFCVGSAQTGLVGECCVLIIVLAVEHFAGRRLNDVHSLMNVVKTVFTMYILSQTFKECGKSDVVVSRQDLVSIARDICMLVFVDAAILNVK